MVTVTFLELIALLGRPITFFVYAALAGIAYVFTWLQVPETSGRSLEALEADLAPGRP